jgi:hypothetical protein
MQSLCCWPTRKTGAWLVQIVLTSSPKSSHAQRFFQAFIEKFVIAHSIQSQADMTFSPIVMVGNGFEFWKIMPTRRRTIAGSTVLE